MVGTVANPARGGCTGSSDAQVGGAPRALGSTYARMISRTRVLRWCAIAGLCLVAACEEREPAPPPEEVAPAPAPEEPAAPPSVGRAPASDAERRAVDGAREAAQHLGRTLRARLFAAMEEGPEAAARVCAEEAQALSAQAAEERGARAGRSSLRLRNEANAGPAWVRAWLREHGERPAEGVAPAVGVAGEPAVARFVAPIAVEGPCVLCHGDPAGFPAEVRAILAERYPRDRATGYAPGDLRGALWAEVPVEELSPPGR